MHEGPREAGAPGPRAWGCAQPVLRCAEAERASIMQGRTRHAKRHEAGGQGDAQAQDRSRAQPSAASDAKDAGDDPESREAFLAPLVAGPRG